MTSPEKQLLMAGQPATGKTTFLALLWLAILGERTPGMRLANFQDDRSYLNQIAGKLERCDAALHTEMNEDRDLSLSLLLGEDAEPATLRIPDLSGETWREATLDRHWPLSVEEQIDRSSGLLLFLHGRNLDSGPTIGETNELADSLAADDDGSLEVDGEEGTQQRVSGASGQSSKRKHSPPTQVALVDALQLICEQRGPEAWRVAIVISAWDLVPPGPTPSEYIAQNLPLLQQYKAANDSWLQVRAFGLSAQGGDFVNHESREMLRDIRAVERATTLDGSGAVVGVHEIAAWALGLR